MCSIGWHHWGTNAKKSAPTPKMLPDSLTGMFVPAVAPKLNEDTVQMLKNRGLLITIH